MRLWSVHPKYLDRQGLVACWREALLAQRVLAGATRGYRAHPQLVRFRSAEPERGGPRVAIEAYLEALAREATGRGYRFDRARIGQDWPAVAPVPEAPPRIEVTDGQLRLEAAHLVGKVTSRSPAWWEAWKSDPEFGHEPHPLFAVVCGPPASWERAPAPGTAPGTRGARTF